jgi:hypothetical protein
LNTHIVTSIFKHSLRLDLRSLTRGLSYYVRIEEMHFTHIRRRILKIRPSVRNLDSKVEEEPDKPVVSFRITKGNIHDTKKFGQLMKESAGRYSMIKYMVTSHTTTEGRTSIY